ncbi:alpha/beta fold hydrolase [Sphingopyxis granuli]|uniref:4-(2-oxocyclohexyl)-2-hydroxy-buta-2,4-dienoic acid hydrolase n=1 Tax=Sphingopyxis granuli TaxID=267128 RepID=A0AA86GLT6_9SPHN|nr:alpha/beta hydrolase [Sphingopyxis granuli]AMG75148.1 4-(2-oxocyclohexyl)-2-hydroxy-buta-2,4-dienoic acid hydrolase [Sphingopyxis granuli]
MSEAFVEKRLPTKPYETHVMIGGDPANPPLLLVHGAGPGASAGSNWRHCFADLVKDFYVIAHDMTGFGQSEIPDPLPPHAVTWMGLRIEQAFGVLDELGIEKTHIVGNSMGGALALHMLMEQPDRFDKVMTMGPAGAKMDATPELVRLVNFYADPRLPRYREVINSFVYDPSLVPNLEEITQERFKIATDPEVRRVQEVMFESMKTGMPALVVPPSALKRIPHEVALVHGRHDRVIPLQASLYLLEHLQRAELFVLDRCGHWAQIQRWDAMLPIIRNHFLETAR